MIKKFIQENNTSFNEGERNSSVTILIGFSQFKGLSKQDLIDELRDEITKDVFILNEIERLFDYCKAKNYKSYWKKKEAKSLYKF